MIPSFDPAKSAASAGASVGASLGARAGPVGAGVGAAGGYIAGALVAPVPGRKVLPDGGEIEESESSEQTDGVAIPVTEA